MERHARVVCQGVRTQSRALTDRTSWRFWRLFTACIRSSGGVRCDRGEHSAPTTRRPAPFLGPMPAPELGISFPGIARIWRRSRNRSRSRRNCRRPETGRCPVELQRLDSAQRPDAARAFALATLPDGSDNPLRVERRFGSGTTPIRIDPTFVSLSALQDDVFTGGDSDIPPGFGGPETMFHHGPESDTTNGRLESLPHNVIHGAIGGVAPNGNPNDWRDFG